MKIVKTNTGEYGRVTRIFNDQREVTFFNGKTTLIHKDRLSELVDEKKAKAAALHEIAIKMKKMRSKYEEEAKRVEGRSSDVAVVQKSILERVVNDLYGVMG